MDSFAKKKIIMHKDKKQEDPHAEGSQALGSRKITFGGGGGICGKNTSSVFTLVFNKSP